MKKTPIVVFISLSIILGLFCSRLRANTAGKIYYKDSISMIGIFDNGLKYHIQQNTTPKGQLVVKWIVKSGQNSDVKKQKGMAHFLEHMLFQGTEHFPKLSIIDTLEKSGMRFGRDFNAVTHPNYTEYYFKLPNTSDSLMQTLTQILNDWISHRTLLDSITFEKERHIILTEITPNMNKRKNNSGVLHLTREQLKSFYHQHYTPDNMLLLVVGDMAIDTLHNLIYQNISSINSQVKQVDTIIPTSCRKKFNDCDKQRQSQNAVLSFAEASNCRFYINDCVKRAQRELAHYAERSNCRFYIKVTLNSNTPPSVAILFKLPYPYYDKRGLYPKQYLLIQLSQHILDQRLNDQFAKSSLFHNVIAGTVVGNSPNTELFIYGRPFHANDCDSLLVILQTHINQFIKYGVSEQEFQQAIKRQTRIDSLESILRPNTPSEVLVNKFQNTFQQEDTIYGVSNKYAVNSTIYSQLTTQELNSFIKYVYQTQMQSISISANELINSRKNIKKIQKLYRQIAKKDINVYKPPVNITDTCILPNLPHIGKNHLQWEIQDSIHDIYSTTLSNGIAVTFKPNISENKLTISARAKGGIANLSDSLFFCNNYIVQFPKLIGIGSCTRENLQKNEKVKQVSFTYSHGFSFSYIESDSDSLYTESQLKLFNVLFTQIAILDTLEFLASMASTMNIKDNAKNEFFHLCDSLHYICSGGTENIQNFIRKPLKLESIKDAQPIYDYFCKTFTNPFPFHFFIVGNIEKDTLLSLLETYIGSLPFREYEQAPPFPIPFIPTKSTDITLEYENLSTAHLLMVLRNQIEANFVESQSLEFFTYLLHLRLRDKLRNAMNSIYASSASMVKIPYSIPVVELNLVFECLPNQIDSLTTVSWNVFDSLLTWGPTEIELNKAKSYFFYKWQNDISNNFFLLGNLQQIEISQNAKKNCIWSMEEYQQIISEISCETVRRVAYKYWGDKIYTRGKNKMFY